MCVEGHLERERYIIVQSARPRHGIRLIWINVGWAVSAGMERMRRDKRIRLLRTA